MGREGVSISAFDCAVLRSAFRKSVTEESIPEDRWREHALLLIREYTGRSTVDAGLPEWIMRK